MVPSLEKLCIDKVPVAIAIHPEVKYHIWGLNIYPLESYSQFENWKCWLMTLVTKQLGYPPKLLDSVQIQVIPFIALNMLKWAIFYFSYFDLEFKFNIDFINGSLFTERGLIDEEKAAKAMLQLSLPTLTKYKIGCYYFFEGVVRSLWCQLREISEFKEVVSSLDPGDPIVLWSEYIEEYSKLSFPLHFIEIFNLKRKFLIRVFGYGLTKKNVSALKYCFCKTGHRSTSRTFLYEAIREVSGSSQIRFKYINWPLFFRKRRMPSRGLLLSMDFERNRDIIVYFMRQMGLLELVDYFHHQNLNIFKHLLLWPFQDFLGNKAIMNLLTQDVKNSAHLNIIRNLVDLIKSPDFGSTYDYRNLLKDYLIRRPLLAEPIIRIESLDKEFTYFFHSIPIFKNLFMLDEFTEEDEQTITLILEQTNLRPDKLYFIVKLEDDNEDPSLLSMDELQANEDFLQSQS